MIAQIEQEYDYDEDIVLSKFIKKHGQDYSQEDFLKFLKKRYEIINKFHDPDDFRFEWFFHLRLIQAGHFACYWLISIEDKQKQAQLDPNFLQVVCSGLLLTLNVWVVLVILKALSLSAEKNGGENLTPLMDKFVRTIKDYRKGTHFTCSSFKSHTSER